jgi:hypothetical protein
MQNKANFKKVKFDVTKVLIKDYVQLDTWSIRKTKPIQSQLKPIQSQSKPIKANIMPKQSQFKPNLSCVASGEAGTCRGVASGEAGNEPNSSLRSLWRSRNKLNLKILPQRVTRAKERKLDFGLSYIFGLQIGLNGAQYSEIHNLIVWLVMKRNYRYRGIRYISQRCFKLKGRNHENQRSYQNFNCSDYLLSANICFVGGRSAKASQPQ